jgi:spore germination protein GerM
MRVLLRVVVVGLVGLSAACGVPTDDRPRALPDDRVPFGLLDPAPPSTTTLVPTASTPAAVYMVAGDRLTPVVRQVPAPLSADKLLQALLAGVRPEEAARHVGTAIAALTRGSVVEEVAGRVRVDLTPAFLSAGTSEPALAVAQIVYTVTGAPGVTSVTIAISGQAVEVPAGDGTSKSGPVGRADFAAVAKL